MLQLSRLSRCKTTGMHDLLATAAFLKNHQQQHELLATNRFSLTSAVLFSNSCVSSASAPCNHRVYEYHEHASISLLIMSSSILFSNTSISSEAVSTIELTSPVASDKSLFINSSSFVQQQKHFIISSSTNRVYEDQTQATYCFSLSVAICSATAPKLGTAIFSSPIPPHVDFDRVKVLVRSLFDRLAICVR